MHAGFLRKRVHNHQHHHHHNNNDEFHAWLETRADYKACKHIMMSAASRENSAIPKLAYPELHLGRIVGQGGFSVVTAIHSIDLDEVYNDGNSSEENKLRAKFSEEVQKAGKEYVMKTLRTDLPEEEYAKGIVDLAIEADFLRVLNHPNVISMRAMANSDPGRSQFFVVLDKLTKTLDKKFNEWRAIVGSSTGYWFPCYGYCCSNIVALHENWKERLRAAFDIAFAMEYLHAQQIIYRDLKPDNIGFDQDGVVKLFDFGLAKRIEGVPKCQAQGCEDLYMLTGNTGSLRYMAPEIALDKPYNLSVDAYSYGILFWQICSLQTPYANYSQKMHADRVVKNGQRPKIDKSWPVYWGTLQQQCWSPDRFARPPFTEIASQLKGFVEDVELEDGVIPSRTLEIRAKKKRKKVKASNVRLDVDTRISTPADSNVKRFETDVV